MKLGACLLVALVIAAVTPFRAVTVERPPTATWTPTVTSLTSPAAANSAQPQLSVQGAHAVLSWIERSGDAAALRFSERNAAGWTDARTVASGTNWFVNWADVPSVVRLENGQLAAHWLQ